MYTLRYIICCCVLAGGFGLSSCNSEQQPKKYGDLTEADYTHITDTVDGEEVNYKTATTAYGQQGMAELTSSQLHFIRLSLAHADTLINKTFPGRTLTNATIEDLDKLIDIWNTDSTRLACTQEYFVAALGSAFGEHLVETYHMKWRTVTDEYGTDFATVLPDIELVNYPLNSVQKAIDQDREEALKTISLVTKKTIEDVRNEAHVK